VDLTIPIPIFDILAVCLGAGAIIRAWMKDGGLFANIRDDLHDWVDRPPSERPFGYSIMNFVGRLANCAFCQTYHAVLILLVLWWLAHNVFQPPWGTLTIFGIYWLALTRLVHHFEGFK